MLLKLLPRVLTNQIRNLSTKNTATTNSTLPAASKSSRDELLSRQKASKEVTKEDMQWRKSNWHQHEGKYYNALRVFYTEDNRRSVMQRLQTKVDLSPSSIKRWWNSKMEEEAISQQCYVPARQQILGNELAAAHFIVHRGGSIKFFDEDKWVKADKNEEYILPRKFDGDKTLQAIDCENMELYYEGLSNFANLEGVEWLSLNGCENVDDWCIDKIANIFSHSLVYLDLRNCPAISDRGIGALYKMPHLKILYLDDFLRNTTYEMTCLMLQEVNPLLEIQSDVVNFDLGK